MNPLLHTLPRTDGFSMPAEYEPHSGTVMIWPVRPGSWGKDPAAAQQAFLCAAREIAKEETVWLLADAAHCAQARALAGGFAAVLCIENNDAWARDTAPTFVSDGRRVRGVSWRFNAWGGAYDGLYADWAADNALAGALCAALGAPCYDAGDFVLEGGSVHSDGEGTLLTTESCLLSPGRNPALTRDAIENRLRAYLGAEKVLWLPRGISGDETNEHVDNMCAFTAPGKVVLAWTDYEADPQYALSRESYAALAAQTDARGRRLEITRLPIPDHPVTLTQADCEGYDFAPGEARRTPGERLAASYVNFYFTNGAVLVPQFGGENEASDRRALKILQKACPGRRIVGIPALAILKGGGNLHCITQQIPKGAFA